MNQEITVCIVLQVPVKGVLHGLQKGSGSVYETEQKQQSDGEDLRFVFPVKIKTGKEGLPDFAGHYVHGPTAERFIYIDIGTSAGQFSSPWTRRLKVPLRGITWEMIEQVTADPGRALVTEVPGAGKDGTPNCATVKPFPGWQVKEHKR